MENLTFEIRANVKFLTKFKWEKKQILEAVQNIYGDSAPSWVTVHDWIRCFKEGRESLEDDPRSGRPATSVTDENVNAVQAMVEEDQRIKVEVIAETLGISTGSVHSILKEWLGLSKLCARSVPKALRPDQKCQRAGCSVDFFDKFDADPDAFMGRVVTGDEIWIYLYDSETKLQSKQWLPTGGSGPVVFKVEKSAMKLMATVFWDAEGVIMVDFLDKGKTVTCVYYEQVLHKLRAALQEKRPGKLHQRVLFHYDNAHAHRSKLS